MRRLAALLGVVVVALGSIVLLGGSPAFACKCIQADAAEHAASAAEVFVGTITSSGAAAPSGDGVGQRVGDEVTWSVDVDRVWKGDPPSSVEISSGRFSAACGLGDLPQGREVLFFVDDAAARSVGSCGGTTLATPDLEAGVTAALGEPMAASDGSAGADDPEGSGSEGEEHPPLMPLWSEIVVVVVLLGAVGLLIAAAVWLGVRRGRRRG